MKFIKKSAFSLLELSIVILVIGLLIAGILTAQDLSDEVRLTGARKVTNSAPVTSIDSLVLWLETTQEDSFDAGANEDQTEISNWHDINKVLPDRYTAVADTNKPKYNANGINRLPSLQFDGVDDYLRIGALSSNSELSLSRYTIFLLIKNNKSAGTQYTTGGYPIFSKGANGGETPALDTNYALWNLGAIYGFFMEDSSGNKFTATASVADDEKPKLISLLFDGSDSKIYINTNLGATQAVNAEANTKTTEGIGIGTFISGGNADGFFGGDIGEIIMFERALKDSERKLVEDYLIKKWKL